MLKIEDLHVSYGGIQALRGIDIDVTDGQIISLIGANGAGKSTLLRAIMGLERGYKGKILHHDEDITHSKTKEIVKNGIVLVPEGRRIFPNLTVRENLVLGAYTRNNKQEIHNDIDKIFELFPRLKERIRQKAGTMSGGEQQMLAVGRGLMTKPKLMMLDEPSLGLAPLIVKDIFDIIRQINKEGVTILLVEQNAKVALEISNYAYVLETGKIVLDGLGKELLESDEVKQAYLGA